MADALERVGLLPLSYRVRRAIQLRRVGNGAPEIAHGLPLPPARLRQLACNTSDPVAFLHGGAGIANLIVELAIEAGADPAAPPPVLEFGCGCGRILRHFAGGEAADLHAVDVNSEQVDWCRRSLPFVAARAVDAEPPLPYPDGRFGLVYGLSVLTHMPVAAQRRWVGELARVLEPGGLLFVSLHGEWHADRFLRGADRARFAGGEPVVLYESLAGTNGCFAFHPREFVEDDLLGDFRVERFLPHEERVGQDVYLARLV
jgi:SAM-dependent methyltransferase